MRRNGEPQPRATGSCLCGAVRYQVDGPLRDVVNCHCRQCLRQHGHIGAYTAAPRDELSVTEGRGLKWYRSSHRVRRGFCGECGSTLFWDPRDRETVSIAAGTLDQPAGLKTVAHIFTADLAGYYTIDDTLPRHPQGLPPGR